MKFSIAAEAFSRLEEISGRLQMIDILGELFKKSSKDDIANLIYLMQGRLLHLSRQ